MIPGTPEGENIVKNKRFCQVTLGFCQVTLGLYVCVFRWEVIVAGTWSDSAIPAQKGKSKKPYWASPPIYCRIVLL